MMNIHGRVSTQSRRRLFIMRHPFPIPSYLMGNGINQTVFSIYNVKFYLERYIKRNELILKS